MTDEKKSWMRRRVEGAIRGGLTRAYDTIKVDPGRFLMQLRVAHGLPLATFHGVYTLPVERLDDVAESVIRGGMRRRSRHQPRIAGERSGQPLCAARDPADRGQGRRRCGGEMGGTSDSG